MAIAVAVAVAVVVVAEESIEVVEAENNPLMRTKGGERQTKLCIAAKQRRQRG